RACSSSQRRLVRLAYRQYTHSANGPKYNAVIGHTASMARIGWRNGVLGACALEGSRDVTPSLITIAFVVAGWSIFAKRLQRCHLTAPIVLVLAGLAVGLTTRTTLASTLDTEVARRVAEFILAMLLFLDATDVRGGLFGRDPRSAARLLFVALPLSVALSVLTGRWLLPKLSWSVLAGGACAVTTIGFAPAPTSLGDERVPKPAQ